MTRLLAVVVSVLLIAVPILAQEEESEPITAAPTVLGSTGAVLTPTTDLPPVESFAVGYHWINDTFDSAAKLNVVPIKKLEVGLAYLDPAAGDMDEEVVFNAKYRLVEEDEDNPALMVGVWDIGDELDQTWYGVISKRFEGEVPIVVNLGGASGDALDGFFGSIKLELHEDVDVIGEYDSSELNFAVRIRPYTGVTIDLLTVDNRTDREFGVGAAYTATW
ncbi:MAG: hypothetical protein ACUVX8_10060 [Candidatus Zipacnadales bacterium]